MIAGRVFPPSGPELDQPIHNQPAGEYYKRESAEDIKEGAVGMKVYTEAQLGEINDLDAQGKPAKEKCERQTGPEAGLIPLLDSSDSPSHHAAARQQDECGGDGQ